MLIFGNSTPALKLFMGCWRNSDLTVTSLNIAIQ